MTNLSGQDAKVLASIKQQIANKPVNTRVFTIPPAVAEELLDTCNSANRPFKPSVIDKVAGDLQDGNWFVTGDTLKFDRRGVLRDGQNRLGACVQSGLKLTTHIAFNIDPAAFPFLDSGKKRTPADALAVSGVKNYNLAAGAVRWARLLDTNKVPLRTTFTPAEILDFYKSTYRGIEAGASQARRINNAYKQLPAAQMLGIGWHLSKISKSSWDQFADDLQTGSRKNKPALKLITELHKMTTQPGQRVHDGVRCAMVINAWNHFRKGTMARHNNALTWNPGDPFPTAE